MVIVGFQSNRGPGHANDSIFISLVKLVRFSVEIQAVFSLVAVESAKSAFHSPR